LSLKKNTLSRLDFRLVGAYNPGALEALGRDRPSGWVVEDHYRPRPNVDMHHPAVADADATSTGHPSLIHREAVRGDVGGPTHQVL
jgi:hypothetical protein